MRFKLFMLRRFQITLEENLRFLLTLNLTAMAEVIETT